MTVSDLIQILQRQPQDLQVAYSIHSEACLLEESDIQISKGQPPRPDGWVHDWRPDRPVQNYLMIN